MKIGQFSTNLFANVYYDANVVLTMVVGKVIYRQNVSYSK